MVGMDVVREFKRRAEEALPGRVARVVLYGSRARGDAKEDSDWDVAVFLAGEPGVEERWALGSAASDLLLESGALIQPVAMALSRAEEDSQFLRNIRKEGVAL